MRVDPSTDKFMNSTIEFPRPYLDGKGPEANETFGPKEPDDKTIKDDSMNSQNPDGGYTGVGIGFTKPDDPNPNKGKKTARQKRVTIDDLRKQRRNAANPEPIIFDSEIGLTKDISQMTFEYNWFQGPNGEEVIQDNTVDSKNIVYFYYPGYKSAEEAMSKIPPPPRVTLSGVSTFKAAENWKYGMEDRALYVFKPYVLPANRGSGADNWRKSDGFKLSNKQEFRKITKQKILGATLASINPLDYGKNRDKRGIGVNHPAYGKYQVASETDEGQKSNMQFSKSDAHYSSVTKEEIKKYPQLLYHDYSINAQKLGVVDNLAMMYAIRNALFSNINFEDFKILHDTENFPTSPASIDELPHAYVEYVDVYKILDLYHGTIEGFNLDNREEALATVIKEVVGVDNNYGETEDMFKVGKKSGKKIESVPKPIRTIKFRDDNKEHELIENETEGDPNFGKMEVKPRTGSQILSMEVTEISGAFSKNTTSENRISTLVRIPKYLVDNSNSSTEAICNDINRLFTKYYRKFNDVLNKKYSDQESYY